MDLLKFSKNLLKNVFFYQKFFKIFSFDKNFNEYFQLSNAFRNKLFHKVKINKNYDFNQEVLQTYLRNKNSLFFSLRKKYRGILLKFFFSQEQTLNYFENQKQFLITCYTTKESIERFRKNFIEKLFLCLKNIQNKKKIGKNGISIIIIPNQTSFFQILRTISVLNKRRKFNLSESRFYEKNFLRIKLGKLIKPADNRINFNDGYEDFINIKCFFKKKKIKFSKKTVKTNFFFLSPLFLRSLHEISTKNLFSKLDYCFIDNFHIIIMQNSENLPMILKNIFNKKKIKEKRLNKIDSHQKMKFQIFISFECFFFPIFFSSDILNNSMVNYEKDFKKEKIFKFSKLKNYVYLKFQISKKINPNKQKLNVFKKKLSFFILSKIRKKTLLFCKRFAEYIFLRNHFIKISQKKELTILMLNEYLSFSELTRRKNSCKKKKKKKQIILMTERYYYHHRSIIFTFHDLFFYSFPNNWEFFFELINSKKKNKNFEKIYFFINLKNFSLSI